MKHSISHRWALCSLLAIFLVILASSCTPIPPAVPVTPYMKMLPAPDSDKPLPVPAGDNSCWLHNAADMLAGAGYGTGSTVQVRADDIFSAFSAHFGTANGGWTSTAIQWWLGSSNNTQSTTNPYTLINTFGSGTMAPWTNANAAMTLANDLRMCNMVGLGIRWPTGHGGSGGHAITLWGDDQTTVAALTANPGGPRVTDSDTDSGGDVQAYTYDAYTNPNPGGVNEGNGWYFNAYGSPHPYISAAWTLSRTTAGAGANSVRVTGSYKIQNTSQQPATDLHYKVGTDVDILTYRTWLDYAGTPTITENQPAPRRELTVDWVFTDKKVDPGAWVTISTEFVETSWNSIHYNDVHFTYADGTGALLPDLTWKMDTPKIDGDKIELIRNIVGGYVIGSFDVINTKQPDTPAIRYRFVHQYLYNQQPEFHDFALTSDRIGDGDYLITNLFFGQSYAYPTEEELWRFEKWLTRFDKQFPLKEGVKLQIDWKGKLPYPEGFPPSTGGNPEIK